MISAVLDANTLISAILVRQGISHQILRAAYAQQFRCFSSAAVVTEVTRAFTRPRVQRKYQISPDDIRGLRGFLESDLVFVPITASVRGVATHPEDDLILATAVSARADYLVTGDRQLQALGNYEGILIVSPRQFLAILQTGETP